MKKIRVVTIFALMGAVMLMSCKKNEGCTDPTAENYNPDADKDNGTCIYKLPPITSATSGSLTFSFAHRFGSSSVTNADFNLFNYVTANNDTISLSNLRYLISDIRLYKSNGDSLLIEGYRLVDMNDVASTIYKPSNALNIPFASYTGISFIFGFDSLDNVSNNYIDLNSANWNWPANVGGGYHFMQLEGKYKNNGVDSTFAFHMGTAYNTTSTQNYFKVDLMEPFTISNNASIQIKMDISEWFKNPTNWDLNLYHSNLMMNFTAQQLMNTNGRDVFNLGVIVQ